MWGIAGTWINAVSLTDGCRIDLVFDLDASAAAARAGDSGGRAVAELTELTTSPEINLVIIGTPTPSHSDLVVEAARNGKHVMCEKPMALDLASCQRKIDACAEAGVKLAIGHTLRFKNAFFLSRQLHPHRTAITGARICASRVVVSWRDSSTRSTSRDRYSVM